jgi:ribosomal protein L40E
MNSRAMNKALLFVVIYLVATVTVCVAASPPPTVSIINPKPGTQSSPALVSLSPTTNSFKVQVLVWNDVADITSVEVGYCAGADTPDTCTWNWVTASSDPNYDCGTNCGIYNATLSLTAGDYWLLARAQSSADGTGYSSDSRTGNDAKYFYITVLAQKTGTGMLLVRDNSSRMCMDCHSQIQSHSSQSTGTDYGNWQTVCLDCHIPHNTKNIFLVKENIITPNSGLKSIVFYNTTGDAQQSYVDSSAGASTTGICQACHTQTGGSIETRWQNTGDNSNHGGNANPTQKCTDCHIHTNGFAGIESEGGSPCNVCHSYIWNNITSTTGYHHYIVNSAAFYPVISQPVSMGGSTDQNRGCLMCHVDHDIFRPDMNANGGRAKNLRASISVQPSADTPATYANTDFINDANYQGGICMSCHRTSQTNMGYTQPDGSTAKPAIPFEDTVDNQVAAYNSSAHQYTASSTFTGTLTNVFAANCSKCHNDTLNPKSSSNAQRGSTYKFGNHQSTIRRVIANLGAAATDPMEETFCYECHSGAGTTDYYGVASMSAKSKSISSVFTKTYIHPVGDYSGLHNTVEATTYNDGSLTGTNRHAECADCHNPHAASAENPLKGASGVEVSNPTAQFTDLTSADYTYLTNASTTVLQPDGATTINLDYKICLKCHSNWAYGAESNAPNPTPSATWQQTNIAKEFNVNNWSYHYVEGDLTASVAPDPGTEGTCSSYGPTGYPNQTPRASTSYGSFNSTYVGEMEPTLAGLTDAQRREAKLRCSSCHGIDGASGTTPEGPHGSAYAFILKVPSGSLYTQWDNTTTITTAWCLNCHDPNFTNTGFVQGTRNLHATTHDGRPCQECHVAIPHGWKRYRFLKFSDCDTQPYNTTGTTGLGSALTWGSSGNWAENDCHNAAVLGCG